MSVLKSKRKESAIKFLDTAYDLDLHTIKCCMKLPKRYTFLSGRSWPAKYTPTVRRQTASIPPDDLRVSFVSWCGHISSCRSWRTRAAMKEVYLLRMQKSAERFISSTT